MPQNLSPSQLAQLAYNAGFRGSQIPIAVAVAMAESGGNPAAYNPESAAGTRPGMGSKGLWQIYSTAHPWANTPAIYDPQQNANAAFRVFREAGNSFRPWSTFNNGMASNIARGLKIPTITRAVKSPAVASVQTMQQTADMGGTRNRVVNGNMTHLQPIGKTGYQGTEVETKTLGVLESVQAFFSILGSRSFLDWSAMGVGGALVLIGVIMLLWQPAAPIVKTAIKAAL